MLPAPNLIQSLTDDANAARANDAAFARLLRGGAWYLSPGIYPVTTLPTNPTVPVIIQGAGVGAGDASGSGGTVLRVLGQGIVATGKECASRLMFRDFRMEAVNGAASAISATGMHSGEISNVQFRGFGVAVSLATDYSWSVDKCEAIGCGIGYRSSEGNCSTLQRSRAQACGIGALNFQSVDNYRAEANGAAVLCRESGKSFRISKAWLEGSTTADVVIDGCVASLSDFDRFSDFEGDGSRRNLIVQNKAQALSRGPLTIFYADGQILVSVSGQSCFCEGDIGLTSFRPFTEVETGSWARWQTPEQVPGPIPAGRVMTYKVAA